VFRVLNYVAHHHALGVQVGFDLQIFLVRFRGCLEAVECSCQVIVLNFGGEGFLESAQLLVERSRMPEKIDVYLSYGVQDY
jgi:hypothetical protein